MQDDEDAFIAATIPAHRFAMIPSVGVVDLGVTKESHGANEPVDEPLKKKKKVKRRKPSLYSLYHETSSNEGSQGDLGDEDYLDEAATMYSVAAASTGGGGASGVNPSLYEYVAFEIGMDINVLLNQVHQNILRSICLDDSEDATSAFTDGDLICLAASLRHNRSLMSLQLRYLPVTDVSLVPLCSALEQHPTLRALDLSGTKGTRKTGEALRRLVCVNTNILHVMHNDTMFQERDLLVMGEALQFNAMMCADPRSNPYDVKMISKVTEEERAKRLLDAQLSYNPWVQGPPPTSVLSGDAPQPLINKKVGKKNVAFETKDNDGSYLSQRVCGDYIKGACRYGSRCKYYHPPWTAALGQVAQLQRYNEEEEIKKKWESLRSDCGSTHSVAAPSEAAASACHTLRSTRWEDCSFGGDFVSVAPSFSRSANGPHAAVAARRRKREAAFTLDARRVHSAHTSPEAMNVPCNAEDYERERQQANLRRRRRNRRKRLLLISTVVCCLCTTVLAAAASTKHNNSK